MNIIKRKDGPWRESYRPGTFLEFSPTTNVEALSEHVSNVKDRSHTYIFHGETGSGKTSAAYIVGKMINCESPTANGPCNECNNCMNYTNIVEDRNIGDQTGVDASRELISRIQQPSIISGLNKVVILDEAHALSKVAQKAWLKVLEDPKPWLYVFFCTTDPSKFLPDIRNRCHQVKFSRLNEGQSVDLITSIAASESVVLTPENASAIYQKIGGRPRELVEALQTFSQGGEIEESKEEQIKAKVKDLVDGLLSSELKGKPPAAQEASWTFIWDTYMSVLKDNSDNAEGLRRVFLFWLWMYAENKNGWNRKHSLTRILDAMDIFSKPLEGEDEKYQLATMMFKVWKYDY